MSLAARQSLCNLLSFEDNAAKGDLMDVNRTSTFLVALLEDLVLKAAHPILITAIRSDHHDDSGLGHFGHSGGWAADLWHADWEKVGDEKIRDVIVALIANPYCWSIGLAGYAQKFANLSSPDPRVVIFLDDGADHVHCQAGNANGSGRR